MDGSFDDTTLTALAITLTVVAAAWAFLTWRRNGLASGVRGLAWTLVPMAALLTGTLRLAVGIVDDVAGWAARLVLSPVVWSGLALAGVAVVLYVVAGMMTARGIGVRGKAAERAVRKGERVRGRLGGGAPAAKEPGAKSAPSAAAPSGKQRPGKQQPAGSGDDDMDEIEAILRKHGI
ncbi:hypothetical protein [Nocardioides aequoreus]|uniref:hypothetical protein n=1 Tax=Nocardioides aequoreus TaxID=397278 RepID=UPI00068A0C3F|nr:hypothetical protein [Nocardioides aequoreus]